MVAKRKSPIRHQVHTHYRRDKIVNSFLRGHGSNQTKLADPAVKIGKSGLTIEQLEEKYEAETKVNNWLRSNHKDTTKSDAEMHRLYNEIVKLKEPETQPSIRPSKEVEAKLLAQLKANGISGEVRKTKNDWVLVREDERRESQQSWKKPRYVYTVFDARDNKIYLTTFNLEQANNAYDSQSKFG